ncbi:MAG: preprotein translocase subunit SecA [Bernardetiaceae bacterium]
MINAITKAVAKVFGTKSDRDIKTLQPYVAKVNAAHAKLMGISDDELRNETPRIKGRINEYLSEIDKEISAYQEKVKENPDMEIFEKEEIFKTIDKLEEQRDTELEKVLLEVLPEAFAVVKETARRFKENGQLVVQATPYDQEIATKKTNVGITPDYKAIWSGTWEVAGSPQKWDMVHYDVQIIGGVVLHQGKIAEMATGEGKTLVSTFPSYLNALAGRGVHLVTVNDYLAKRDAEWMAPLFEFHGFRVDCIDKYESNTPERKTAYEADITYGTNNEFGFDYLRDNMSRDKEDLVQRKHHFAMVDEVDSVLIDDARTPLIISGPVANGDQQEYDVFKPRVQKLYQEQEQIVRGFLNEARRLHKEGKTKEVGLPLFRAYRGLPKYKPLIKFLGEAGVKQLMQKTENYYLQDNARAMPEADEPLLFTIEEKSNAINLTEQGLGYITKDSEDKDFFVLPDISIALEAIEKNTALDTQTRAEQKEKLIKDYQVKTSRIHTVNQLLKAYTLFEKDVDYVVMEVEDEETKRKVKKVMIVDEQTGRIMDGRRYSDGLHQALESKESVKIEAATQTYATVTLQNYFRMYHKLAGMTGTAETEAGEFWEIYKLDVVVIPTNRPIVRDDRNDRVYRSTREKFKAVVDEVKRLNEEGRPVLIGTASVETSELLDKVLTQQKIPHDVLNAKQHAREAEIVAKAGKSGAVTIATNMAGRGTDIKLDETAKAKGGLAIIGTERHDSRRVDRQLRGRAGRQGDPGSSQFFVSLDDKLMRMFGSDRVAKIMDRLGLEDGEVIEHSVITNSIERAQKKVEENNFSVRKRLLEFDDVMNAQREVIYKRRRHALYGQRLTLDVMNTFYQMAAHTLSQHQEDDVAFQVEVSRLFNVQTQIDPKVEQAAKALYQEAYQAHLARGKAAGDLVHTFVQMWDKTPNKPKHRVHFQFPYEGNEYVFIVDDPNDRLYLPFKGMTRFVDVSIQQTLDEAGANVIRAIEQTFSLAIIDDLWKDHLREMDDLRTQVNLATIEQKDPLLIYKFEGYNLFKELLTMINEDVVKFLSHAEVAPLSQEEIQSIEQQRKAQEEEERRRAQTNRASDTERKENRDQARNKPQPRRVEKKYKRNDRVKVRYQNGEEKEAKYKDVSQDIEQNRCVLVDN